MADGSLDFDANFDMNGVNKATDMVNKSVSRMYQRVKQAFSGKEIDQSSAKMKQLRNNVDEANAKVEKQIAEIERLRAEYESLKANGDYVEPEATKFLMSQAKQLEQQRAEARAKVAEYNQQWKQGIVGADNKSSEWVEKVQSLQAKYAKVLEKIEKIESKAQSKQQTKRNAQLAALESGIANAETKLGSLQNKADVAKAKLREALSAKAPAGFKKGLTGATAGLDKFVKRIGGLAKRVFIFTVITRALRKLKELLTSMTSTDKQVQTSLANTKGNLLTAFQPIYEFALPAIKALLHALEQASAFLASFTAALFGKSVSQMQKNAKALNKQATATSKVGKAAEKASRSLASFDELNQLSDNSSSSSGATDASSAPSFDSNIADMETNVKKITAYATILAGIALVMVGIATANISAALFGVGLIITGIAFGKGSGAFSGIPQWVHQIITWGSMILGVVLIVLGCYLGFNPKLILAGLAMLGTGLAYGSASGAFDVAFAKISEFKDNVINKIKEFGVNVKDWWNSNLAKFFTREYWQEKFNNIRGRCADFKNAVFNGAQNLVSRIASSASNLWNKITSGASRMWDSIKNSGRDRLNGIISLVERCINTVVNKANRISWNIPDWVPGIGGKKFGFNLPTVSIPRLATGTVVPRNYGEYTAILGDNKREPEVVSPLSTMKQAVREVINELGEDNSRPISISIYTTLDGKVVGQSVIEYHNGVVRRTGKTPLAGVSV